MPDKTVSHNVCSVPHYTVSYYLSFDSCSFLISDIIGEFSIIDPSFQLETYGNFLCSDRGFLENYSVRRVFLYIENNLPSHLENLPHQFTVLNKSRNISTYDIVYSCRCHFNSSIDLLIPNVDFDISLAIVKG